MTFPQVFITWFTSDAIEFRCLGTIITKRIILTSASCMGNGIPNAVKLSTNTTNQKMYRVDATLIHYAFNVTDNTNDIAMVRLAESLVWSSDLFPACLWINTTHVPVALSMVFPGIPDIWILLVVGF